MSDRVCIHRLQYRAMVLYATYKPKTPRGKTRRFYWFWRGVCAYPGCGFTQILDRKTFASFHAEFARTDEILADWLNGGAKGNPPVALVGRAA